MYRRRGFGTVQDDISAAASRYGVPSWLALAVAQRESGFNQNARGTSGEIGVFQLMPGTAAQLGVNPLDLSQNIDGGVRYLSQMYGQFGDWRTALEAYNGGPGNVSRGTISSAAQGYADAIMGQSPGDMAFGDDSSLFPDVPGPSDGGLSPGAMAGLGIAGLALLWAALS
jgi:soluble lytic murein transglycosylase-like protein